MNTDAHWDDFREIDFDDQALIKKWVEGEDERPEEESGGEPRRFDVGMLVDSEIIGSFINRSFLDPEDDRVLDEMLNHEIGGGLRLRDLIEKEVLRATLRKKQQDRATTAEVSKPTSAAAGQTRAGPQAIVATHEFCRCPRAERPRGFPLPGERWAKRSRPSRAEIIGPP